MEILIILTIYFLPVFRFLWLVLSNKLKQKVAKRGPYICGGLIYAVLSLISGTVVLVLFFLPLGGASGVPLVFLLPIQILLIIVAESFIAKSKSNNPSGYEQYKKSKGDEWFK